MTYLTTADNPSQAIQRLLDVMARLRDPEWGCPWDLQQSMASLVPFTIEEVYEVVDSIERNDMVDLQDELGDLLLQVVFYAQLASEKGYFQFSAVAKAITDKLIRRHPHIFPDGKIEKFGEKPEISAAQVMANWDAIKDQERLEKRAGKMTENSAENSAEHEAENRTDQAWGLRSILDDVPRALPALERSRKLQKRASTVGFDWDDAEPVIAKLKAEIAEYEAAAEAQDSVALQHELGDILFAAVNLARHTGVESETALRAANKRFEKRFKWIEKALHKRGEEITKSSLDVMDELWNQAKEAGL